MLLSFLYWKYFPLTACSCCIHWPRPSQWAYAPDWGHRGIRFNIWHSWPPPKQNSHHLGIGDPQSIPLFWRRAPFGKETSFEKVDGKQREWEETFTAPGLQRLFPEQSHPPAARRHTRPDTTYCLTPAAHGYSGSFHFSPTCQFLSLRALRLLLGPTCACHMSHFKRRPFLSNSG